MIRIVYALALASLSAGCASTMNAGIAHYTVKPFYDAAAGKTICCQADVINGKNIAAVTVRITKTGDDYTVDLTEQGVDGSTGQGIASQTASSVAGAVSNAATSAAVQIINPVRLP